VGWDRAPHPPVRAEPGRRSPDAARPALAGPAGRVLDLQRSAGNSAVNALLAGQAVQRCGPVPHEVCPCNDDGADDRRSDGHHHPDRLAVQRQPAPAAVAAPPAPATSALDESQIKDIEDFSGYGVPERLGFIERLHKERWVGPGDEAALERIWRSFGADLPRIADANIGLYEASVDYGAELDELPPVAALRGTFPTDVKGIAARFLVDNRSYVTAQLEQLGLQPGAPGGSPQDVAQRQADALADIKRDAEVVTRAQQAQRGLLTLQIGWETVSVPDDLPSMRHVEMPALYDPQGPPPTLRRTAEQPPLPTWEQVDNQYKRVSALIAGVTNANPAVYAAMREDGLKGLTGDDPQAALQVAGTTLRKVLSDIDATGPKIAGGDLDYRDLVPIHQQLFAGMTRGPTQTDWSKPFARAVAKQVLADHEASEFWISLGLGTLAAAAFIVAELATAGSATFFIAAGVGVGAGAVQAGRSWEQYFDMAQAAKATVRDDMSVLSRGQASAALLSAVIDTAFVFLDAYQAGAKGARAAAKGGEAAGREAAEQAERQVRELASKEAADAARAVERRGGAAAAREAAEATGAGVLHEAPAQIGKSAHQLKAVGSSGRATLWLCSDCVVLIDRVGDILKNLPADHAARTELGEILANAQRWQAAFESTQRGARIGDARLVRETNDLASRLSALSAKNADIEGLLFFRTFLAGSDEAARILGEQLTRKLTGELGQEGFVQLVRDLGPDALRNLTDLAGDEIRRLVDSRGRDLVRWLGDGGVAGGAGGLSGARARELLGLVPDKLLTAFRSGRSRTSALVVYEAVKEFGAPAIQRLRTMMGEKFTGAVLDDFRQWRMVTISPDLAPLVRGGRGKVVREVLPPLRGRTLAEIEDFLRSAGMQGPTAERGLRIWTHADGSVVRIKVGKEALRGQRTAPHLVSEISERPGRYGVDDIIAKVTQSGHVVPAGPAFAETSLGNWFRTVTGHEPKPDELKFLTDLWADAGHTAITR